MATPNDPTFHGPKDYLDLARSPSATPDQLRDLAKSPYRFVLEAVAAHASTPSDVLANLMKEAADRRNSQLLFALVENPTTPQEILGTAAELVLTGLHIRDDHWSFRAGIELTRRDDTPNELLFGMLDDPRATTEFRKVVARETSREILRERLQEDRSERVRKGAKHNPAAGAKSDDHGGASSG
jgi:hypothetical protein